jgi:hypothetical protein
MVVLAGINAIVATHRIPTPNLITTADTRCPETSKAFARRMKDKFILQGPQDRTEGEKEKKDLPSQTKNPPQTSITKKMSILMINLIEHQIWIPIW